MNLNKQIFAAAIVSTLAVAMTQAARAGDVVTNTHPLDGANQVYLLNDQSPPQGLGDINGAGQGSICHGLNKNAAGTPIGYTISGINNDTSQVIYLFTGPSCDGYFHNAHPGQVTTTENSTNTSDQVLVKSYYFR